MKGWYSTIRLNNDMEEISKEPLISTSCDYYFEEIKSNQVCHWIDVYFKPKSGFYHGYLISFKIIFPQKYPFLPPSVFASNNFLHPNLLISEAKVYSSFLQNWTPVNTFKAICEHLIDLLFEVDDKSIPNDGINQTIRYLMINDPNLYKQIIDRYYLNMKDVALKLIPMVDVKQYYRNSSMDNSLEKENESNSFDPILLKTRNVGREFKFMTDALKKLKIE